ncbi:MAG: SPOR domain-containing protein [Bacteroidetes bacterium]|nr:SPOR domain-containing protein [Bacteroidota bacterium]
MRSILFFCLFSFLHLNNIFSQVSFQFDELFFLAKDRLAKGDVSRALPMFEKLNRMDSVNANMRYLLGVCHLLDSVPDTLSITLLESGLPFVRTDYDPGSPHERNTPIFTWFYLSLAYSLNDHCEDGLKAFKKFQSLYGIDKEDYYIHEAGNWIDSCARKNRVSFNTILPEYHKILTKGVDYTTLSPLWGVQVGAYSKFIPLWEFDNLKNVDAYMDRGGMIRYVIGHFSLRSQAEALKKAVLEKGYKDAFIVDVNHESRYSEQVTTVDDQPVNKPLEGRGHSVIPYPFPSWNYT